MKNEPGKLEDALPYMLHRTARLLRFSLLGLFRGFGYDITPEQWFILYRLWEKDRQSQIELGDKFIDDRPNITRLVDGLQKNGLVTRQTDTEDRRKSLVSLTKKGSALLEKVMPIIPQERDRILAGLTGKEAKVLRKVLKSIEKNLTQQS